MSATPFEPIYQAAEDAGIKLVSRIEKPLRKAKRFIVHGSVPLHNLSNMPDYCLAFTTRSPGASSHNPAQSGLGDEIAGHTKGLLLHPTKVFGYNPK